MSAKRILIVAAHPDDETLGAGGTIAKHIKSGDEVKVLIMSFVKENAGGRTISDDYLKAINCLGLKSEDLFLLKFPDNQFDIVSLLDIIRAIEGIIDNLKPEIIYTHSIKDLNVDHRIINQAVITATRPGLNSVKEIYAFEILSSTELNFGKTFNPNYFVDISDTIDDKIEAIKCYKNELREYPHPRSIEGILSLAKYRGIQSGLECVEAFEVIRKVN